MMGSIVIDLQSEPRYVFPKPEERKAMELSIQHADQQGDTGIHGLRIRNADVLTMYLMNAWYLVHGSSRRSKLGTVGVVLPCSQCPGRQLAAGMQACEAYVPRY